RAHMAYDGGGLQALKSKPSGGRKRENMTLAEERVLLARFAKAAGAGDLKAAYERDIGHATSNSTVYNLGKPALDLSDIVRQRCTVINRSIVVRAFAVRSPELLGRAERSSPNVAFAARRRRGA
ncbi:MAG: hypothetical protein ACXWIV_11425, partial [Croceibacterium sp.]